jgi:hypothetical protein
MRSNSPLHKTVSGAMAYEHSFDARVRDVSKQRSRSGMTSTRLSATELGTRGVISHYFDTIVYSAYSPVM